jgi:hypothetical protein
MSDDCAVDRFRALLLETWPAAPGTDAAALLDAAAPPQAEPAAPPRPSVLTAAARRLRLALVQVGAWGHGGAFSQSELAFRGRRARP